MTLFSWVHKPAYQKLFSCLPDPTRMRFVGGVVRNTLLGIPFDDVDFATSYKPEEIIHFFKNHGFKVIPTGIEHGTVTVLSDGHAYEITTLRRDVETDGRHAVVAYTSEWEEDAERRDFTMNALYVDCQGIVHDYVSGQQDIKKGLIRFIGAPEKRVAEDYLRILRFFRFWALYGCAADPAGLEVCCTMKEHLNQLSSERITKEMLKILGSNNPWSVVRVMQMQGFDSLVWGHCTDASRLTSLEILENSWGPASLLVRLAWLVQQMPNRLTLSKDQKKHLNVLWRNLNKEEMFFSVYEYGLPLTKERLWMTALMHIDKIYRSASDNSHLVDFLKAHKRSVAALDCHIFPTFSLSGHDMMALGLSGPNIGLVLSQTKAWWIEQGMKPNHDDCIDYAQKMAQEGGLLTSPGLIEAISNMHQGEE